MAETVVSSFLCSQACSLCIPQKNLNAVQYVKKRFLRLYPIYWVCMGITVVFMLLFFPSHEKLPDSSINLKTILVNLTMLQGLFGVESIEGAYWTLSYELRFYCFLAIVLLVKQYKHMKAWTLVWLGASIVLMLIRLLEFDHWVINGSRFLIMPSYAASFISGIMI